MAAMAETVSIWSGVAIIVVMADVVDIYCSLLPYICSLHVTIAACGWLGQGRIQRKKESEKQGRGGIPKNLLQENVMFSECPTCSIISPNLLLVPLFPSVVLSCFMLVPYCLSVLWPCLLVISFCSFWSVFHLSFSPARRLSKEVKTVRRHQRESNSVPK